MIHNSASETVTTHTLDISMEDLRRMSSRENVDIPDQASFEWVEKGTSTSDPLVRVTFKRTSVSSTDPRELEVRT